MRPTDIPVYNDLDNKLTAFNNIIYLPALDDRANRDCFIKQLIDSIRRIRYVTVIREKNLTISCADATSIGYDPVKAAALYRQQGNMDEAFWQVFLATHFGKNVNTKWSLARAIYGRLGAAPWNWASISADPNGFRDWLNDNQEELKQSGKFGNHRKFESLNAYRSTGTGEAVATYINWVGPAGHIAKINGVVGINNDPRQAFETLYNSMNAVKRFGRTGKFDYLTMIGKLELANIEPGSTFMGGATGPYHGACLLFGINASTTELNEWLNELETHLQLYYGMQIIEDALCNWQKSPNNYIYFGG